MFKSDSHWTCAYLHPEIFRTYKHQQQLLCPKFFLLLAHSSIPVHVDIGGGEKQPAFFLSRTLSSRWILQEHHGWQPNPTSYSQPQPGKISLSRTARLSVKITLLHWAHLVGKGTKKVLIPNAACPASYLSRSNYYSPSTQGHISLPAPACISVHLPEELHPTSPQPGKQSVTPPVVAVHTLSAWLSEVPKMAREMDCSWGTTCFPITGNLQHQSLPGITDLGLEWFPHDSRQGWEGASQRRWGVWTAHRTLRHRPI